jgi:hypothetical protein
MRVRFSPPAPDRAIGDVRDFWRLSVIIRACTLSLTTGFSQIGIIISHSYGLSLLRLRQLLLLGMQNCLVLQKRVQQADCIRRGNHLRSDTIVVYWIHCNKLLCTEKDCQQYQNIKSFSDYILGSYSNISYWIIRGYLFKPNESILLREKCCAKT